MDDTHVVSRCLELEVGKPSGLWEPIHSMLDFDIDMAIVHQVM